MQGKIHLIFLITINPEVQAMNDNLLCSAKAMDNYINEMTARHNLYEFINAINSKFDTNCQIQKTLSLIDKIIVGN